MCQWNSGETAPCVEEAGMIQRGSSGGRSTPSSAPVKQLQLTPSAETQDPKQKSLEPGGLSIYIILLNICGHMRVNPLCDEPSQMSRTNLPQPVLF